MNQTTTAQAPNIAQKIIETVLEHSPMMADDKAQQECWANFGLSFPTQNGRGYLQPGQFLPFWQRAGARWKAITEDVTLSIVSAFVLDGRYMIRGGDGKLGSHPEIQDWENGSPVKGQASELRFPGGVRRVTLGHAPMVAANSGNYESCVINARVFHDNFSQATLHEGCPLELVCRTDKANRMLPSPWLRTMIDLGRREATPGYALPIPMISSNEEEVVLKDYPQNWTNGLRDMLSYLGVTEIGIMYKTQGDDEPVEGISISRPKEVYRNAFIKGDLGFSTLDPDLYERMLPLATGRFYAELAGV
jgi:hypothetical protein